MISNCGKRLTLKPILRSSHSCEQPLSLLLRHSLMKQLSSSEPSPQSSLRSHSKVSFKHFPLRHMKADSLHVLSEIIDKEHFTLMPFWWFIFHYAGTIWEILKRWMLPESVQRGFLGASSERSWQSNSPSHSHFFWLRQRPLAQRNSSGPHVGYSAAEQGYEEFYIKKTINHILLQLCGHVSFKCPKCLFQETKTHTHHILGTHQSHRSSQCHGHIQSALGCTVCSGTWTHSWHHTCCWCTLEAEQIHFSWWT